jgi:hypothetical protein
MLAFERASLLLRKVDAARLEVAGCDLKLRASTHERVDFGAAR